MYSLGKIHSFFGYSPPVSVGWGQVAKFAVFLVAKILKMHIFDLFERLHPPNNFKNKKQALGALPQTPLSLARPQGQVANLSTYPYGECWVDSRRQG